jgi:SulP family sulfate permease
MGRVPVIDATGEKALHSIAESCRRHKVRLMVSGLQPQPTEVLESTGLLQALGNQNIYQRTGPALDSAMASMEIGICSTCTYSPFRECATLRAKGLEEALHTRREG